MNNQLRKKLLKLIVDGAPDEEIEKVSEELLKQKTTEEKAEVAQILQEAKAEIHAKKPPPKEMYV